MTVVGYVVDRYPRLSQTFVTNEIRELRSLGFTVPIVSLEHGDTAPPVADDVLVVRTLHPTGLRDRVLTKLTARRDEGVLGQIADEVGHHEGAIPAWKLPAVARWLASRGVERIHAHFGWQAAGAAWALAEQLRIPWTVTLHANDIFSRRLNLHTKVAAAERVITVCEYNIRYLRDELGITRPIDKVVCGVEVPRDEPAHVRTAPDIDVLAVGRLVEKKGFDVLVRAVADLCGDHPHLRAVVVGDGPQRGTLVDLAADLGVRDSLTFAGALPHDAVLEHMARARIFALPARVAANGDRDSMPVVIKEAMARRVPVVASDIVAIPEMVDNAVGRLVPADDVDALAKALGELLDDPAHAADLGIRGRRRVEERFTLAGEVAKLAAIFEGRS